MFEFGIAAGILIFIGSYFYFQQNKQAKKEIDEKIVVVDKLIELVKNGDLKPRKYEFSNSYKFLDCYLLELGKTRFVSVKDIYGKITLQMFGENANGYLIFAENDNQVNKLYELCILPVNPQKLLDEIDEFALESARKRLQDLEYKTGLAQMRMEKE